MSVFNKNGIKDQSVQICPKYEQLFIEPVYSYQQMDKDKKFNFLN